MPHVSLRPGEDRRRQGRRHRRGYGRAAGHGERSRSFPSALLDPARGDGRRRPSHGWLSQAADQPPSSGLLVRIERRDGAILVVSRLVAPGAAATTLGRFVFVKPSAVGAPTPHGSRAGSSTCGSGTTWACPASSCGTSVRTCGGGCAAIRTGRRTAASPSRSRPSGRRGGGISPCRGADRPPSIGATSPGSGLIAAPWEAPWPSFQRRRRPTAPPSPASTAATHVARAHRAGGRRDGHHARSHPRRRRGGHRRRARRALAHPAAGHTRGGLAAVRQHHQLLAPASPTSTTRRAGRARCRSGPASRCAPAAREGAPGRGRRRGGGRCGR